jgi:hypothetical protein
MRKLPQHCGRRSRVCHMARRSAADYDSLLYLRDMQGARDFLEQGCARQDPTEDISRRRRPSE